VVPSPYAIAYMYTVQKSQMVLVTRYIFVCKINRRRRMHFVSNNFKKYRMFVFVNSVEHHILSSKHFRNCSNKPELSSGDLQLFVTAH